MLTFVAMFTETTPELIEALSLVFASYEPAPDILVLIAYHRSGVKN